MITRTKYFKEKYIIACVSMYGIVHEERIKYIHQVHFSEHMDLSTLNLKYLKTNSVMYEKGYFIHESIHHYKQMYHFIKQSQNKPFFMPTFKELSRYENINYIESTPEIERFTREFMKTVKMISHEELILKVNLILSYHNLNYDMKSIIEVLHDAFLIEEDIRILLPYLVEALNSQKLWINHGLSANDIKSKTVTTSPMLDIEKMNPFEVTEKQKTQFKAEINKLTLHLPKAIFDFSLPGLHDLIDYTLENYPEHIIDIDPKIYLAGITAHVYYMHNKQFNYNRREAIMNALQLKDRYDKISAMIREFNGMLAYYKEVNRDIILNDFFEKVQYKPIKTVTKENIRLIGILQKKAVIDDVLRKKTERIVDDFSDDGDLYVLLANMNLIYPLSVKNLFRLMTVCPDNQRETVMKHIIFAFEKVDPKYFVKPNMFKPNHENFKIYLLSLNNLGFILKNKGHFTEALKLYEKILYCNEDDKFKAKESMLICLMYTQQYDRFLSILESLPETSVFRLFIEFFNQILDKEPIQQSYEKIIREYPTLLEELLTHKPNTEKLKTIEERELLHDFYALFSANRKAIQQAIQSLQSNKLIN